MTAAVTPPLRATHLAKLRAGGVVFSAEAALAHPAWQGLPHDATLGACLAWLVRHGLLDDPGLPRTSRHVDASSPGKDRARLRAAVEEALFLLASGPNVNQPGFDALMSARLVTRSERNRALALCDPRKAAAPTPGGLLPWMLAAGVIDNARLEQIMTGRSGRRGTARAALLADARERLRVQAAQAMAGPPRPPPVPDRFAGCLANGVVVALVLVFLAAVAGLVDLGTADPLPECSDPIVAGEVRERLAQDDLYPASEGWGTPGKPAPVVGKIAQLYRAGYPRYPSSTRLRVCRAPIRVAGTAVRYHKGRETAYVFTIERTHYAWIGFTMTDDEKPELPRMYDPALDDPGAPLGRDALERAFRAGIAAIAPVSPFATFAASTERAMQRARERGSEATPERFAALEGVRDGIGSIEALGPCTGRSALGPYRCRLRFDYFAPMSMVLRGIGPTAVEGEFTFVRGGGPTGWRVTDEFADQVHLAVAESERRRESRAPRQGHAGGATRWIGQPRRRRRRRYNTIRSLRNDAVRNLNLSYRISMPATVSPFADALAAPSLPFFCPHAVRNGNERTRLLR